MSFASSARAARESGIAMLHANLHIGLATSRIADSTSVSSLSNCAVQGVLTVSGHAIVDVPGLEPPPNPWSYRAQGLSALCATLRNLRVPRDICRCLGLLACLDSVTSWVGGKGDENTAV